MKSRKIQLASPKKVGLRRVLGMKYALTVVVGITIMAWFTVTLIYGYLWVNNVLKTEVIYGYERSRLLISTAFIAYKLPYLLIALIVIIVSELLITLCVAKR